MIEQGRRIFVAGHRGLVGQAIVRSLLRNGCKDLILASRDQVDLLDQRAVDLFFERERPEVVCLAAAKVGGILANAERPADFIYQNLQIQCNTIESARRHGARRFLFLGSSCIYPKFSPQPIKEDHLLTGSLEPTNEPYALAKIAGIKMCEAYSKQFGLSTVSLMPTNLYGPGDNFDPLTSHVLPALIRKFAEAKIKSAQEVTVWGSGLPRREFLYVDDLAEAVVSVLGRDDISGVINVGVGKDVTIAELAETIKRVIGYKGAVVFDPSKPDGTPRKLLDVTKMSALGWQPKVSLEEGIQKTYEWYLERVVGNHNAVQ